MWEALGPEIEAEFEQAQWYVVEDLLKAEEWVRWRRIEKERRRREVLKHNPRRQEKQRQYSRDAYARGREKILVQAKAKREVKKLDPAWLEKDRRQKRESARRRRAAEKAGRPKKARRILSNPAKRRKAPRRKTEAEQ